MNMHPVIQTLIDRRFKTVPTKDGKSVSLLLFGGTMAGAAGAGAMIALEELGLTNAFDAVYCVSASLGNASYLLSHQARFGTHVYYEDLIDHRFLNFFKIWKPVNFDSVVRALAVETPLDVDALLASKTKLFVRLFNTHTKTIEYLETQSVCKDTEQYLKFFRASIAFPLLSSPVLFNGQEYTDGGVRDIDTREHLEYCIKQGGDILVIYNDQDQKISHDVPSNVYEIVLPWKSSRFQTKKSALKNGAIAGGACIKKHFGLEESITL